MSDLITTTRAALDQAAETYANHGLESDIANGGRQRVRMSCWGWITALACIDIELFLVIVRLNSDDQFIVYGYFAVVGTLLAAIDVAVMRLPDSLTLPSYPAILALLGLNAHWFGDGAAMARAVEACGAVLGLFLLLCLFTDTGLGDLKFAGLIGLTLGARSWGSVVEGFAVAWGIAAVWGIVQLFRGRLRSRIRAPCSPCYGCDQRTAEPADLRLSHARLCCQLPARTRPGKGGRSATSPTQPGLFPQVGGEHE